MADDRAMVPAPTDEGPGPGTLAERLADDLARLDTELGEIELLVTQATAEAARHESRRAAAAEKLEGLTAEATAERLDLTTNLVTLTKRAALMETQVDVLEGKRRALQRYRDGIAGYVEAAGGLPAGGARVVIDPDAPMPPEVSRLLLTGQEDLRREIARAMHDGPAQSLTNIVLQAQIVERLVEKDPAMAVGEVRQLIGMVQQTLEATKSFIFDVRPMVLDDLGLVPTLRRATRERGAKAGVTVEFDSMGQDRRLPMDLETSLFRILDEALAAYLTLAPEKVSLRLDWGDQLEARLVASRTAAEITRGARDVTPSAATIPDKDLPPALAQMMEQRITDEREALEAAERDAIVVLPATTWREIQDRAAAVGVSAELLGGGGEVHLMAELPVPEPADA